MSDSENSDPPEPIVNQPNPQSVEGLFLVALGKKTAEQRKQFLDEMCGDNAEHRRRVEALLLAYDDAGSFLEKPPVELGEPQEMSLDFLTPSDNPDLLGTLGEYDIFEVIGQGGMGIVFRASDAKLNRIVAIKVMSPFFASNPNARKRFLREAQAAAAVSHPHIVTIHAVDEEKLPYLVMECVRGQSLQEKLDKVGSLEITEILRIGSQIAEGLVAAHKQGLIHRDIKPANILLENGVERVKITDFGLARAVDDVTITKTGEVSGTPQYMSPEQATGSRVDQRSDLFSLGAVLYAMCTGRSPFRASNLAAVVRRVCDDTPRPIEETNPEIPFWLIDIINQLLEKDPDARIQTAEELAEQLNQNLANAQQPIQQPKPRTQPARATGSSQKASEHYYNHHIRKAGRFLIGLGSCLIFIPMLMILSGYLLGNGDPMQLGGTILTIGAPFALPAIFLGGLMLYLVHIVSKAPAKEPQSTTLAQSPARHYDTDQICKAGRLSIWLGLCLVLLAYFISFSGVKSGDISLSVAIFRFSSVGIALGLLAIFVGGVTLYFARIINKAPTKEALKPAMYGSSAMESVEEIIAQEQRSSNKRILIGVAIGLGLLLIVSTFKVAWNFLFSSSGLSTDVLIIGLIASAVVVGTAWAVRKGFFNGPYKFVSWLVLTTVVLVPSFFLVDIQIPKPSKKPRNYSPVQHTESAKNEAKIIEQKPVEQKPKKGAILLDIQGEGLTVGIFPDKAIRTAITKEEEGSEMEMVSGGSVFRVSREYVMYGIPGRNIHEFPVGTYDVVVSSNNAGWINGMMPPHGQQADGGLGGSASFEMEEDKSNEHGPLYPHSKIEVKSGEILTVTVKQDFKKLAENHPDWSDGKFFKFIWPKQGQEDITYRRSSQTYLLTLEQAKVVQRLFKAFADGKPEVSEADLLAIANKDLEPASQFKTLNALFNNSKHPAWNSLILSGKEKETWRLSEPE